MLHYIVITDCSTHAHIEMNLKTPEYQIIHKNNKLSIERDDSEVKRKTRIQEVPGSNLVSWSFLVVSSILK